MNVDRPAIRAYVRGLLATVPDLLKVAAFVGDKPTWREQKGTELTFAEVSIPRMRRAYYAAPEYVEARPAVRVDLYVPYDDDPEAEAWWDAFTDAVMAALEADRYLGDTVDDTELPQLVTDEVGTLRDKAGETDCRHAVIEVECVVQYQNHSTG